MSQSDEPDEPTYIVRSDGCDFVALHPDDSAVVVIGFNPVDGSYRLHLELTPEGLASLEATLETVRAEQSARRPIQ